jgi:hypothetical protein
MPILDYRKGTVLSPAGHDCIREALMLSEFYNVAEGIGSRARKIMLHRHVHSFFDPIASGPTDVAEGPVAPIRICLASCRSRSAVCRWPNPKRLT